MDRKAVIVLSLSVLFLFYWFQKFSPTVSPPAQIENVSDKSLTNNTVKPNNNEVLLIKEDKSTNKQKALLNYLFRSTRLIISSILVLI